MVFEAADHTPRKLARYWDTVREKGDPKTSPAVDALHELLLASRQARMYVFTTLGREGREQFSRSSPQPHRTARVSGCCGRR
ncbi:hypothetical protein [Streptomyces decoyicus]|uniref:hypothetical protein n=1 Tax=Streptomyces decoyicus TaxID=249567 RepID=UPI003803C5A5